MVGSRTLTAVVGLLVSVLVTVALWWYFETLLVFLFLPFIPVLFRGFGGDSGPTIVQECPHCGFQATSEAYDYCPRDGSRLEEPERE
ncbi:hypothetical protein [Haloarcula salinisoli]|uniref:Uncharacterized protein n=1 Tax=Haloarcula salinisoli TaxID=2487746 RepID=A0A8J7YFE3_9EURY|nr:hypothetical protein [Halomicroarcula salinisoli]MBX0287341.1 hypothetical protein [Halomicroarcula salinisoli]MBX0305085.1 hypothetical protein [Halomicroarcula salinisoli]